MSSQSIIVRLAFCFLSPFPSLTFSIEYFTQIVINVSTDEVGAQQIVGHHLTAKVALTCECIDAVLEIIEAYSVCSDFLELCRSKQKSRCNSVAELLDFRIAIVTANSCLAEPHVRKLMQQRERPSGARVLLIYDHERRNLIRQRKSAEYPNVDIAVVRSEISQQQDKYARIFNTRAKHGKGICYVFLSSKFS